MRRLLTIPAEAKNIVALWEFWNLQLVDNSEIEIPPLGLFWRASVRFVTAILAMALAKSMAMSTI